LATIWLTPIPARAQTPSPESIAAAKELVATIHPSAILRAEDRQEQEYKLFVKDLHTIAARIRKLQLAS